MPDEASSRTGSPETTRTTLNGVPAIVERPSGREPVATVLVFHGATASKEEAAGGFAGLTAHGIEVVYLDAALHGERADGDHETVARELGGYRNFVWESVRRTCLEMPAVLDALGERRLGVIGTSMGGYVAHWLLAREPRVRAGVTISTTAIWHDPAVTGETAAWLEANRPSDRADVVPPRPVLVVHGELDGSVPTAAGLGSHARLALAYERAGCPERLGLYLAPGMAHATSPEMTRRAVDWLGRHLGEDRS